MTILLIQVMDDSCEEDERYTHRVPLDTDKVSIITAIAVLYPGATSIYIAVEEE